MRSKGLPSVEIRSDSRDTSRLWEIGPRTRVRYMPFRLIYSKRRRLLPLSMEGDEQDQVLRQDHPDRGLIIDLLWSFFYCSRTKDSSPLFGDSISIQIRQPTSFFLFEISYKLDLLVNGEVLRNYESHSLHVG
ncbi:Uncharacterized protein Fot_56466 [Forsythia ovata]|uniref:Uncharacterized protein n=1 Tax=Forsythia ovata TaxID=205694 RepID=A0ABD1NZN0_9LAMI